MTAQVLTLAPGQAFLSEENIELKHRPSFSPNLAHVIFSPPNMKQKLRRQRFPKPIDAAVCQIFNSKWFGGMKNCIKFKGDYFDSNNAMCYDSIHFNNDF